MVGSTTILTASSTVVVGCVLVGAVFVEGEVKQSLEAGPGKVLSQLLGNIDV